MLCVGMQLRRSASQKKDKSKMGRSRFTVINESPHFLTCTVVNWIPMFSDPNIVKLLLDSLMFLQNQQRLKLFAYVIMENHLHLLASAAELSKEIGNFKSFTARQIVDYLEEKKHVSLLKQLSFYKSEHKKDRNYQLWQEGSHPEMILSEKMFQAKLEYIHNNPVKRGYVDQPDHWRYSSARNYLGLEALLSLNGLEDGTQSVG
jgi:REP element-mobilizing transposase RayT